MGEIMETKKRNSILLWLAIAAFLFLGYQTYNMINQVIAKDAATSKVIGTSNQDMQRHPFSSNDVLNEHNFDDNHTPLNGQTEQLPPPSFTMASHSALTVTQKEYLRIVNQYELTKMKRQLLDEKEAIAKAHHRIASLNKKTQLIYGNKLLSRHDSDLNDLDESYLQNAYSDNHYQLKYIDFQKGKWSAVFLHHRQYYEVSIGAKLPDHSLVLDINHKGVTLLHNSKRTLFTFNGQVILPGGDSLHLAKTKLKNKQAAKTITEDDLVLNPSKRIEQKDEATTETTAKHKSSDWREQAELSNNLLFANKNPRGKPQGIFIPDYISPTRSEFALRRLKGSERTLPLRIHTRKVPAASRGVFLNNKSNDDNKKDIAVADKNMDSPLPVAIEKKSG